MDHESNLYYLLGINITTMETPQFQMYTDVWKSRDAGYNWELVTSNLSLPARYDNFNAMHYCNAALGNVDVMYVLNGKIGGGPFQQQLADLWASKDGARSWTLITTSKLMPWNNLVSTVSQVAGMHITTDGAIMVTVTSNTRNVRRSDLWTSFDGGYTWGRCIFNATYGSRNLPAMAIDNEGRLYMMGGYDSSRRVLNDVWISDVSLSNVSQLALMCNKSIPSTGVGLTSLPGETSPSAGGSAGCYPASPEMVRATNLWYLLILVALLPIGALGIHVVRRKHKSVITRRENQVLIELDSSHPVIE